MFLDFCFRVYQFFILKILKTRIIFDYKKFCPYSIGNALLYYKIDPFLNPVAAKKYYHTNNREILEIVKILNKAGFIVDIADRDIQKKDFQKLKSSYDVFIGLGAGNSGKYFADFARKYPSAIKILYAAGPEPSLSNQLIEERYKYFSERHPGIKMKLRRMITEFSFKEFADLSDAFFVVGNEFSLNSYKPFNKPMFPVYPSTAPNLVLNDKINQSSQKNFLFFGGNGNIVKGLDLLIEVFSELPDLNLYICAPKSEEDFNDFYKETIQKCKNIHFIGFIKPAGKLFNQLTEKCGYVILPSCSEGIATSVITCMRRGLVPVVTYESGIDTGDFGYLIEDIQIDKLKNKIKTISETDFSSFRQKSLRTYQESERYTIEGFRNSFKTALENCLKIRKTS